MNKVHILLRKPHPDGAVQRMETRCGKELTTGIPHGTGDIRDAMNGHTPIRVKVTPGDKGVDCHFCRWGRKK